MPIEFQYTDVNPCGGNFPFNAFLYIKIYGVILEEFYKYRTKVLIYIYIYVKIFRNHFVHLIF